MENNVQLMALEMVGEAMGIQAVQEGAASDAWKTATSRKLKDAKRALKAGKKLAKQGDYKAARKEYDESLKMLEEVRKEANKIDDDDFSDALIQWFFSGLIGIAILAGYAGDFSGRSREAVIKSIDSTIKQVKNAKARLED